MSIRSPGRWALFLAMASASSFAHAKEATIHCSVTDTGETLGRVQPVESRNDYYVLDDSRKKIWLMNDGVRREFCGDDNVYPTCNLTYTDSVVIISRADAGSLKIMDKIDRISGAITSRLDMYDGAGRTIAFRNGQGRCQPVSVTNRKF
jgi:hypothetical protein